MPWPSEKILKLSPGRRSLANNRNSESADARDSPTNATEEVVEQIASQFSRVFRTARVTCTATSDKLALVTLAAKWMRTKYLSAFMLVPSCFLMMGRSI